MTERNWQEFFTAADFLDLNQIASTDADVIHFCGLAAKYAANKANAILREELAKALTVYCYKDFNKWYQHRVDGFREPPINDTHKAKLIQIEEIKPEPWAVYPDSKHAK